MESGSEVYWLFASKIYEPPLSTMREDGSVVNLANPLAAVMLVVDFETEVSMNGIIGFIGNSAGQYARQTVEAMRILDCDEHAEQLAEILDVADAAGMTFAAVQQDRQTQQPFAVSSFSDIHGTKWNDALTTIHELEEQFDADLLVERAEEYVGKNVGVFKAALGNTDSA